MDKPCLDNEKQQYIVFFLEDQTFSFFLLLELKEQMICFVDFLDRLLIYRDKKDIMMRPKAINSGKYKGDFEG